eukprot:2053893-Ditylum_brightwellii.AAC.1
MASGLNQKVFMCKALGRKWHKTKIKLIMNGGELYMVFWISHMGKGWHDKSLRPNYIKVVQIFCYGDKVHTQSRQTNTCHQAVIVCQHNHGACYTVLWFHHNTWNKIVSANHIIGIDPFKGHLRRYPNDFGMGHETVFGAGFPN